MGCHTWVYGLKCEIEPELKENAEIQTQKEIENFESHLRMSNTISFDIQLFWLNYFNNGKLGLYETILNEYNNDYFSEYILNYYFAMYCYCSMFSIPLEKFPLLWNEYLKHTLSETQIEKTRKDLYDLCLDNEISKNHIIDIIHVSDDQKHFWKNSKFHDPFRVYPKLDGEYPTDEPFMNRESLEQFLFNDKLHLKTVNVDHDRVDVVVSPNGLSSNSISPREEVSQSDYEREIKKVLDTIYSKYPDAIIQFG